MAVAGKTYKLPGLAGLHLIRWKRNAHPGRLYREPLKYDQRGAQLKS